MNIKKGNLYITISAYGAAAVLLIAFLVYPTYADINRASSEVIADRERTTSLLLQKVELDNFKGALQTREANLTKAEQQFLDPSDPVSFVKFLENTASSVNLSVDVDLLSAVANTSNQISSFQVRVEGGLQNIVAFSQKLDAAPYLLQTTKIAIAKASVNNEKTAKISGPIGATFIITVINK